MTQPVGVWIDLDPEPVSIDDPRVRTACLVADGAWVRSSAQTTVARITDVVRAVLAHVDDLAKLETKAPDAPMATDLVAFVAGLGEYEHSAYYASQLGKRLGMSEAEIDAILEARQ